MKSYFNHRDNNYSCSSLTIRDKDLKTNKKKNCSLKCIKVVRLGYSETQKGLG